MNNLGVSEVSLMPLEPVEDRPAVNQAENSSSPDEGLVIELDRRAAEIVEAYRTAKAAAKRWHESELELRDELLNLLGPAIGATLDGAPVVRRSTVESWRVDTHALKVRFPDVWRACQHMSVSQRLTILQ